MQEFAGGTPAKIQTGKSAQAQVGPQSGMLPVKLTLFVNLTGLKNAQIADKTLFLGVSVTVFL